MLIAENPGVGTWIIDEAAFFDERIAYLMKDEAQSRAFASIYPTLVLNFRREIFNQTARLLLETATDIIPLTAYCDTRSASKIRSTPTATTCGRPECPALYFDPLIIIEGPHKTRRARPNYCTRCDEHHYLPGKEYTFFTLKPMGNCRPRQHCPLLAELNAMQGNIGESRLYASIESRCKEGPDHEVQMNALRVPLIAERALAYLYAEQNSCPEEQMRFFISELNLDRDI